MNDFTVIYIALIGIAVILIIIFFSNDNLRTKTITKVTGGFAGVLLVVALVMIRLMEKAVLLNREKRITTPPLPEVPPPMESKAKAIKEEVKSDEKKINQLDSDQLSNAVTEYEQRTAARGGETP